MSNEQRTPMTPVTLSGAVQFSADLTGVEQAAATLRHCFERGDFDLDAPTDDEAVEAEALSRALASLSIAATAHHSDDSAGVVVIDSEALDVFLSVIGPDERVSDLHAYRGFYRAAEQAMTSALG